MKNPNSIHFIMTGGTIDFIWDSRQDSMIVNKQSRVPDFFAKYYLDKNMMFTQVCMKDSRALTTDDLKAIKKTVEESPCTKIVITHGTYTMPDTAQFLTKGLKRTDQTIVLTGSSTPLIGFELSEAVFNLGFAVAKVQDLPNGVYVSILGRTLTSQEMDRSIKAGKFFEIFGING